MNSRLLIGLIALQITVAHAATFVYRAPAKDDGGGLLAPAPAGQPFSAPGPDSYAGATPGGDTAPAPIATGVALAHYDSATPSFGEFGIDSVDYTLTWTVTLDDGSTVDETVTVNVPRASLGEQVRKMLLEEPLVLSDGTTRTVPGLLQGYVHAVPGQVDPIMENLYFDAPNSQTAQAIAPGGYADRQFVQEQLQPVTARGYWDTWFGPSIGRAAGYDNDYTEVDALLTSYCQSHYSGCGVPTDGGWGTRALSYSGGTLSVYRYCNNGNLNWANPFSSCSASTPSPLPPQTQRIPLTDVGAEVYIILGLDLFIGAEGQGGVTMNDSLLALVQGFGWEAQENNSSAPLTQAELLQQRMPPEVSAAINARIGH